MKNIFHTFLLVILFSLPNIAFASTEKVIFEENEITDENVIISNAVNGLTDVDNKNFKVVFFVEDENSFKKLPYMKMNDLETDIDHSEVYLTTQKLKENQLNDTTLESEYVTNAIIKYTNHFKTNSDTDGSKTVTGFLKLKWISKNTGKSILMKHNGTYGSWKLLDSTFNLSKRKVEYGQYSNKLCLTRNCLNLKKPTSNVFSYTANSNWPYIPEYNMISGIASNSYVNVNRGNSTFTLKINLSKLGYSPD